MQSFINIKDRTASLLIATVLVLFSVLLAVLPFAKVSAYSTLNERKIQLGSSKISQTDVTYDVSFKPTTTGNIRTIIIDFCDSPLIGTVCNAPAGFSSVESTLIVSDLTGLAGTWLVDQTETTTNTIFIKNATGGSIAAGSEASFDLGSTGGTDGVTNPSATGTFYARILTYTTDTAGDAYDSSSTGANNPPAATVDAGGVALSTANQLTINAIVQEQLQFCVGTINGAAPADCTGLTGSTVNLGVVDSTVSSISPVAAASGGNNLNGAAMVRTNAANGVVIEYFAEVASGTNHTRALRVPGATCNAGVVDTDQCFNSPDTQISFATAGFEGFGVTSTLDTSSGSTTNVVRDANYDGDGTAAVGFAWRESGAFATLASSTGGAQPENRVVEDEMLVLRFAARADATTPTGSYSVVSTYVATSSF
ncbi:MAG: hypothetical protein V4702_02200 [Patescibacteria group bacterium]